ncbi:uncharacterized protein LOC135170098 [Diachasmimorpha longicaudata]|uniref:uncharacterized protein LOC135170098 n=1 Tax=Diachasmimorpha longicaudata TaxID=58733 RepID=UPI0030B8D28A
MSLSQIKSNFVKSDSRLSESVFLPFSLSSDALFPFLKYIPTELRDSCRLESSLAPSIVIRHDINFGSNQIKLFSHLQKTYPTDSSHSIPQCGYVNIDRMQSQLGSSYA